MDGGFAVSGFCLERNPEYGGGCMEWNPCYDYGGVDLTASIVAALKDVLGDQKGQQGDLVIPVYLGNQLLDEVIVTAQQRMSLRSGGR